MAGNLKHALPQVSGSSAISVDMAELPPGPRLLAVAVQVRAGDGQDRRRVRLPADHVDHRDVPRRTPSPPSGSPRSRAGGSRTGWSPRPRSSSGPELCTRGAISLAEQLAVASEQLDREHADVVERFGDRARVRLGRRLQRAASLGAGASVTRRMPSRWWFSTSG